MTNRFIKLTPFLILEGRDEVNVCYFNIENICSVEGDYFNLSEGGSYIYLINNRCINVKESVETVLTLISDLR